MMVLTTVEVGPDEVVGSAGTAAVMTAIAPTSTTTDGWRHECVVLNGDGEVFVRDDAASATNRHGEARTRRVTIADGARPRLRGFDVPEEIVDRAIRDVFDTGST